MSHFVERKEKDCLNCGTIVHGRFCHICGQENIVTKESFWSLVHHFIEGITHFDGKFFYTLKPLLFKPGHVSKEYTNGKRYAYLHPVRMYLFTSAVFFLIFFSIINPNKIVQTSEKPLAINDRREILEDYIEKIKQNPADTTSKRNIEILMDTSKSVKISDIGLTGDFGFITIGKNKYTTIEEYDSLQKVLPKKQRDGWIIKRLNKKGLELKEKYDGKPAEAFKDFGNAFLHRLPYLLFISLPFFAGILKLLYIRRKQFYYSDHIIFTIHLYIFSFIILLFLFAFNSLKTWTGWGIWNWFTFLFVSAWVIYLIMALKKFYGQGKLKTTIKFLGLSFLSLILMMTLFIFFLFFSLLQL